MEPGVDDEKMEAIREQNKPKENEQNDGPKKGKCMCFIF
jgi:hypothetical protein